VKPYAEGRIAMTTGEDIVGYLHGLQLPASKNEVVHAAKKAGAPKDLWKMMDKKLPWITYQHVDDILAALGEEGRKVA
jgi:hypothetical protein